MTGIEVIVAALAAGASAGPTNTAAAGVQDAYTSLRSLLRPRLRGDARAALDAVETDPDVWQTRIGDELAASGAADDSQVLAAAGQLLILADPAKAATYSITVGASSGFAGGTFHAPVTIQHGSAVTPSSPATA